LIQVKEYVPINRGAIKATQIDTSNIAELEKFYQTTFDIGDYLILPDEREDTDKLVRQRACVWNRERFESLFEEKLIDVLV
jgi:hypothetical protein